MGKKKLQRFAEMATFENVFQPTYSEIKENDYHLKGRWHKEYFKNSGSIVLEVGCGKGEYTIGLARKYPDKNFIGVDIKGARMWRGAKTAVEEEITNVAFIRTKVELLGTVFASREISEIWLTFPDPQMKKTKKRLVSSRFLRLYQEFLADNGIIHLKTDSQFLHEYASWIIRENNLTLIRETDNLYQSKIINDILSIRTFYEEQFISLGIPIKYQSFMLKGKKEFIEPDVEIELDSYKSYGRNR